MDKNTLKLNPKIEKMIKLAKSGQISGKAYTLDEYIEHIKKILNE